MPSLLDWLKPSPQVHTPVQNTTFTYGFGGNITSTGAEVTPESALKNSTVYSCVNTLASTIAQLPVAVMNQDDRSFTPQQHSINALFNKPNSSQSRYEFIFGTVVDLLTYGNAYILKVVTSSGKTIELIPLPAKDMKIVISASGKRTYVLNDKPYKDTQIIHLRDFIASDAAGLSRVKQCAELVAIDEAIDKHIAETFANGTSASGVVSFPDEVEPATAQAFTEAWQRKFGRGGTTKGSVAVLGGGAVFKQLSPLSPADGDIQKLKEQTTARIGAVFKVPSHMLEIFSGSKYNNVQVRNTAFYRDSIAPLTTLIEQKLTDGLLGREDLVVRFDAADILRGDLQQATTVAIEAVSQGLLTVNEGRALMGYSPAEEVLAEEPTEPVEGAEKQDAISEEIATSIPDTLLKHYGEAFFEKLHTRALAEQEGTSDEG